MENNMKNKKNNIGLLIIICVFISILALIFGWFIGKNSLNKNINNSNDAVKKEDEKEKIEEKDYDLVEAEKLINIYSGIAVYGEDYKFYISYDSISTFKATTVENCIDAFKNSTTKSFETDNGYVYFGHNACVKNSSKQINYNDLNVTYKNLFGKNNALEKRDYGNLKNAVIHTFAYSDVYDSFVELQPQKSSGRKPYFYIIKDAKIINGILYINTLYSVPELVSIDGNIKSPYTGIEYNYNDLQKYIDDESQYFDISYKFIFEYEDDHYIFKDAVEQKN